MCERRGADVLQSSSYDAGGNPEFAKPPPALKFSISTPAMI